MALQAMPGEALGRSEHVESALEPLNPFFLLAIGARSLRSSLVDPEAYVRRAAVEASVRLLMPPRAQEGEEEAEAARQAARQRPEVQEMLQVMLRRLELDEDWGVKRLALAAIGEFSSRDEELLEKLQVYLSDPDDDLRAACCKLVGQLAPAHRDSPWLTRLHGLLRDDDEAVRLAAATALGRLAPQRHGATLRELRALAKDEDDRVRRAAVSAMQGLR